MPLAVVRQIFPNSVRFHLGMLGLLHADEIRLMDNADEVPNWRWNEVLSGTLAGFRAGLTDAGAARIE